LESSTSVSHLCLLLQRLHQKDSAAPVSCGDLHDHCALRRYFWVVEPAFRQQQFSIYWTDIVAPIGIGGIWVWLFLRNLMARPLLPLNDPRLGYHSLETEVWSMDHAVRAQHKRIRTRAPRGESAAHHLGCGRLAVATGIIMLMVWGMFNALKVVTPDTRSNYRHSPHRARSAGAKAAGEAL